jgi:hypothetical protein
MRLLFELLLFVVLILFFVGIALIFYRWLSRKFFPPTVKPDPGPKQIETRLVEKEKEGEWNERN